MRAERSGDVVARALPSDAQGNPYFSLDKDIHGCPSTAGIGKQYASRS